MARRPTAMDSPFFVTIYQSSGKLSFSWGSKHKLGSQNVGKVWKGFSTQDHTRPPKQLYRGAYWTHLYVPPLRPDLSIRSWRLSSSWGKPTTDGPRKEQASASDDKIKGTAQDDWYCNYQQQKKKHYDDFMRKMEEDPIGMLFGRRWANWVDAADTKLASAAPSSTQSNEAPARSKRTSWGFGHGGTTSETKTTKGHVPSPQQQSGASSDQNDDRDYDIDPITNRKVPRSPSKSKVSPINVAPLTTHSPPQSHISVAPNTSESVYSVRNLAQNGDVSYDIPVRRFVPPTVNSSLSAQNKRESHATPSEPDRSKTLSLQRPKSWLAQEGFGLKQEGNAASHSMSKDGRATSRAANSKIQSALDRHIQATTPNQEESRGPTLRCDPSEIRTEDVDLLRTSDVRASAGLHGKIPKENDSEKRARHRKLEEEHQNRHTHRECQLAQELAATESQRDLKREPDRGSERTPKESTLQPRATLNGQNELKTRDMNWVNELSDVELAAAPKPSGIVKKPAEAVTTEKANKIKTQLVPLKARLDAMKADYDALRQRWLDEKRAKEKRAANKAREMHEEEIHAHKVAMNAMEVRGAESSSKRVPGKMSSSVGTDEKSRPRQLQSMLQGEGDMASNVHEFANRDRWYKQKAPHARSALDVKPQRLSNDKSLIQELRGIYEEAYGTISTIHRQPTLGEESSNFRNSPVSQFSSTSDTLLPSSGGINSPASVNQSRPTKADIPQSWLAFHTSLLGDNPSSDPLATIQKLFDELSQAQNVVHSRRVSGQPFEILTIIQKLFSELRQIQAIIKDYRTNIKQISSPEDFTAMLRTVRQACKNPMTVSFEQNNESNLSDLSEFERPGSPITYRILTFDTDKQSLVSSNATSLTPFQQLQPVESLKLLNNPTKFFPVVMKLQKEGFTLVAGTSDCLVFKKPAPAQQNANNEVAQCTKGADECGSMGFPNVATGDCKPKIATKSTNAARDQQQETDTEPLPALPASTPSPKSTDPFSAIPESSTNQSTNHESAKSEPSRPSPIKDSPSNSTVRREEAVFSGHSRGHWQDSERKQNKKKHKRAQTQARRSRFKNVLVTGTATAALCYAIGVISQMMQD